MLRVGLGRAQTGPWPPLAPALQQGTCVAASTTAVTPTLNSPISSNRSDEDELLGAAPATARAPQAAPPIFDLSGGGMWWFWQVGALHHLQQHYDLTAVQLHGSSSGAVVAVLAACGVDALVAAQRVVREFEQRRVHDR